MGIASLSSSSLRRNLFSEVGGRVLRVHVVAQAAPREARDGRERAPVDGRARCLVARGVAAGEESRREREPMAVGAPRADGQRSRISIAELAVRKVHLDRARLRRRPAPRTHVQRMVRFISATSRNQDIEFEWPTDLSEHEQLHRRHRAATRAGVAVQLDAAGLLEHVEHRVRPEEIGREETAAVHHDVEIGRPVRGPRVSQERRAQLRRALLDLEPHFDDVRGRRLKNGCPIGVHFHRRGGP